MNENKGKMDEKTNSTVNKRAALVFAVIIGLMLLISQMEPIMNVVEKIMDMMFPVLLGVVLAYVVNPFTTFIERRLYKWFKFKREKTHRRFAKGMAVVLSLFALLLTITLLIFLIIPEFLDNLNRLLESAPAFIERVSGRIADIQTDNSVLMQNLGQYIDTAISSLVDWLSGEVGGAVSGLIESLISIVSFLFDFIVAIVVFVYALLEKQKFLAQSKKMIFALFTSRQANDILDVARYGNEVFGKFVTGKLITSTIVGLLTFLFMTIVGIPYALLSAGIIAITNIIPFFGPFIGGIPTAFIVIINDFRQGIIYIIFLLILQQVEGNVIEPMIMEDQTGVSKFWITFALLLCGGVFGVAGMIFAVPLFAVILYTVRIYVERSLDKKQLPTSSAEYSNAGGIDIQTNRLTPTPEKFARKRFSEAVREWRERVKHRDDDDEISPE